MPPDPIRGYTTGDVARRLRVSEDKVRKWIGKGELFAVDVASSLSGRPQLRITPDALAEFERRRSAAPAPRTPPRRRKPVTTDYYPD